MGFIKEMEWVLKKKKNKFYKREGMGFIKEIEQDYDRDGIIIYDFNFNNF